MGGGWTTSLLQNSRCASYGISTRADGHLPPVRGVALFRACGSLDEYETQEQVTFHGRWIKQGKFEKLSSFANRFMDKLLEEVVNYLPEEGMLKDLGILDQRLWGMDIVSFAQNTDFAGPIERLSKKVNIPGQSQAILEDWRHLLQHLAAEPREMWCSYSRSDPASFWQNLLPSPEVRPALKRLISSFLSLIHI